jgi:hypothetical protein
LYKAALVQHRAIQAAGGGGGNAVPTELPYVLGHEFAHILLNSIEHLDGGPEFLFSDFAGVRAETIDGPKRMTFDDQQRARSQSGPGAPPGVTVLLQQR